MQRLTPIVEFGLPLMEPSDRGLYVLHDVAHATIARLTAGRDEAYERFVFWRDEADKRTAERDEARAAAKAAYERAALKIKEWWDADNENVDLPHDVIRALATEAETTALAEMLDAETRACAQIVRDNGMSSMAGEKAILARLDQRKEAGA